MGSTSGVPHVVIVEPICAMVCYQLGIESLCCGLVWLPQDQSCRHFNVATSPETQHKSAGPGNVNTAPEAHKSYQSRCTVDRETQTTKQRSLTL